MVLFIGACSFSGTPGDENVGVVDASVENDAVQADADLTVPFLVGFDRRRKVVIDNSNGPLALGAVFPIPIGPLDIALMGNDGNDVCVTAFDNSVLPASVEFSNQEAIVWAKADVASDSQTVLWVYDQSMNIGSGECGTGLARANPFADFHGVFHFSDRWDSVEFGARNSAGGAEFDNNQNLSSNEIFDVELDNWATAVEFQDEERFSTLEPIEGFSPDPNETVVFEVLFKSPEANASRAIFDTDNDSCQGMSLKLQASDLNVGRLGGSLGIGSNCDGGLEDYRATSSARLDDDQWHHAAFMIERNGATSQLSLFVDGTLADTSEVFDDNGVGSAEALQVGRDVTSPAQDYAGLLDEVRIGPSRSEEWINVSARLLLNRGLMLVGPHEIRPDL